ncbi:putative nucleolar complex protein 14 [Suhomyces tanzawaensis NRRL Y-17324]|uniref:Putative nucleolar complex protein 14 n=1 Tax=Suhomyces tanzawaensis NRRL Y-17324 TaxID=984487 RepID=A0A1E4SC61_9ASCO|nr:putative nucleolar complex protein 14 [Suhomyces tanzawaensis NRRL Y-17324]ODV77068.1 putative nucleolar complex protein 14 [Suhomyces tanzawaensis NRRL Y-17324]
MAGSQLKQLKAALKSQGLIGQTNAKKKNQKSKTPHDTRRDDKHKILGGIRTQFNQFDQRINRTKHDVSIIQGGKFVKMGSKQHNDATRTHSAVQKNMKMQYDLEKKTKGKTGGLQDRRFGENNKHLSAEEKMLERFTRERQVSSKKRNVFALGSDDEDDDEDDDGGFTLTHSGKALTLDDEDTLGDSTTRYVDEDQMEEGPVRKKTKAEVMKEVIAKAKFYKKQRQQEFQKSQTNIEDLDEDFGDIMEEMGNIKAPAAPKFSTKTDEEREYDNKVRELTYDRRAVPADRTKTEEEIQKEHDEKMKKLETDRLNRMNGVDMDRAATGDDLDDEFWAGSDEEEGFAIDGEEQDDAEESGSGEEEGEEGLTSTKFGRTLARKPQVSMPANHEEFIQSLHAIEIEKQPSYINKIIETYRPNLAQGNKERMNVFVGILFQHILHLTQEEKPESQQLIEKLIKIVKKLAEAYNEVLVENVREEINQIQDRIVDSEGILLKRDLVFFVLVGYLFSTSDHYHLIVTPTLILMNEVLSKLTYTLKVSLQRIAQGTFIADQLLNYQKFSKRYSPELVNFVEKSLLLLIPEPTKIGTASKLLSTNNIINSNLNLAKTQKYKDTKQPISISDLVKEKPTIEFRYQILLKLLSLVDRITGVWKDQSSLIEIIDPFIVIVKHLVKYDSSSSSELLNKLVKLQTNATKDRKPLALQNHRALAIATFAPKFEENFNPDKKSYDINRERQEVNKMKNQLKKERKATLKDIRQETRFVAGERILEKKQMYEQYHKKMANIVNSISTIEGAEKNQYEREKKMRKNKK